MKRSSIFRAAFVAAITCLNSAGHAAPPRLLPFQGRLSDASGTPIADGSKIVQFKIYDAPTGGEVEWAGEIQKLSINGGLVSTLLGSKASLDAVDFNGPLYLEITVDANGDSQITVADPPLLPRQAILPAVFAVEAESARDSAKLQGEDWSAFFDNGNPVTGKINGGRLANGSIGSAQLAVAGITGDRLAGNSVTGAEIGVAAVGLSELGDDAVTSQKIVDGEVKSNDLAEGAVATSHLADNAVSGTKVAAAGIAPDRLLRDIAIFSDTRNMDEPAGGSAAGWQRRTLDTSEVNLLGAQSSIQLNNNTITLQPGTYYIQSAVPSLHVGRFQAVLRDVTGGLAKVEIRGSSTMAFYPSGSASTSSSWIAGVVNVTAGPRQYEIWQYNQFQQTVDYALGVATDIGPGAHPEQNVYTRIVIERLK